MGRAAVAAAALLVLVLLDAGARAAPGGGKDAAEASPKRLDATPGAESGLLAEGDAAPVTRQRRRVLPNYVPVCKRKDPQLVACVMKSVETLRPRLRKGMSRLRVPALEPLRVPALHVQRDLPALRVNASLSDVRVDGAGDFKIDAIRIDLDSLSAGANVSFPLLRVQTEYDVLGQLLGVPLQGKGIFKGNFSDVGVFLSGRAKLQDEDGVQKGVHITELQVRLRLSDSKVDIQNTDAAASAVSDRATAFITANTNDVLEVIRPVVEETAADVVLQLAGAIFKRIPFDEILPDE